MEQQVSAFEKHTQMLSLEGGEQSDTPEVAKFRSLPQRSQQILLNDFPRLLATAMHQYSFGMDCKDVLHQVLEGSPQMLRVRNTNGDSPVGVALLEGQKERATWLLELAKKKNPKALEERSKYFETLTMLCTFSEPASDFVELLLAQDPSQLHRLYDCDGRNLLHHCALDTSAKALKAALAACRRAVSERRLDPAKLSDAVHMNDSSGDTPLHLMAAHRRSDMLRQLLEFASEAGVDLDMDVRQHTGRRWTPLMTAASAGATEAVALLLEYGADPAETDSEGRSAMHLAAAGGAVPAKLFAPYFEPDELAAAGYCQSQAGPVKAAKYCGSDDCWPPDVNVDSGIQSGPVASCGSAAPKEDDEEDENDSGLDCLTHDEIFRLERRLGDKCRCLLDALCQLNPKYATAPIQLMTDSPLVTAFSIWAYSGRVTRPVVVEALRRIGESVEI